MIIFSTFEPDLIIVKPGPAADLIQLKDLWKILKIVVIYSEKSFRMNSVTILITYIICGNEKYILDRLKKPAVCT